VLERAGQAAGIGSRRACQWALLNAGDPARAVVPGPATLLPAARR
jgi:hypothetical protein